MQALIGFAFIAIVIAAGVCLGLLAFAHLGLVLGVAITLVAFYAIAAGVIIATAILVGLLQRPTSLAVIHAIDGARNWIFGIVVGVIAFGAVIVVFSQSFG